MKQLPESTYDLIDELNRDIPHRCPTLEMTDRQIWFEAGRRNVVDALLARKREFDPSDKDAD